jgi:hypothetical protein
MVLKAKESTRGSVKARETGYLKAAINNIMDKATQVTPSAQWIRPSPLQALAALHWQNAKKFPPCFVAVPVIGEYFIIGKLLHQSMHGKWPKGDNCLQALGERGIQLRTVGTTAGGNDGDSEDARADGW